MRKYTLLPFLFFLCLQIKGMENKNNVEDQKVSKYLAASQSLRSTNEFYIGILSRTEEHPEHLDIPKLNEVMNWGFEEEKKIEKMVADYARNMCDIYAFVRGVFPLYASYHMQVAQHVKTKIASFRLDCSKAHEIVHALYEEAHDFLDCRYTTHHLIGYSLKALNKALQEAIDINDLESILKRHERIESCLWSLNETIDNSFQSMLNLELKKVCSINGEEYPIMYSVDEDLFILELCEKFKVVIGNLCGAWASLSVK